MSDRVTQDTLNNRCYNLNRRFGYTRVWWQGRNGHIGLDELDVDGGTVRTVTVGTKREVADFLHAMMVALDMARIGARV